MAYNISNIIAIRTGGVFSDDIDVRDMEKRIREIIRIMACEDAVWSDIDLDEDSLSDCLSRELKSHKGRYVVIAGVFNYWTWPQSSEFSRRLSKEFGTEVLHICWDECGTEIQAALFLDGMNAADVKENQIAATLRRLI